MCVREAILGSTSEDDATVVARYCDGTTGRQRVRRLAWSWRSRITALAPGYRDQHRHEQRRGQCRLSDREREPIPRLAASVTQLDPETLPLQIVPALACALIASFTSFWGATISAFVISIMYSLIDYMSAQAWFPQSGGVALPGTTDLLIFIIIIAVLFWRGARIPGRGELIERRLPDAPRPRHLWRTALICAVFGAVLLVVFPYDFRQALINTLIGVIMALSLVVITGYVGQISVIQLSLAGAAGFTVSHMAVNFGITFPLSALAGIAVAVVIGVITAISAVRVRGVSLAVTTLAGAVAIEDFGFNNSTWGGGNTGSPVPELKWFGIDFGSQSAFKGIDGNVPSPVFGWVPIANDWIPQVEQNWCRILCLLNSNFVRSAAPDSSLN